MSLAVQKKLFVTWRAVSSRDEMILVPGLIPALLSLRQAGYALTLFGLPDTLESHRVTRLLTAQGVTWDHVIGARPSSSEGEGDVVSPQGYPPDFEVFSLIREDIWARRLDRVRSAVVGIDAEDQALADILGLPFLGIGPVPTDALDSPPSVAEDGRSWQALSQALTRMKRMGKAARRTRETAIEVAVDLGGDPSLSKIKTGIGYFDHMLDQLARHGGMELVIDVEGDLEVDDHHTVEDTGLALGEALRQALGDLRGVARYGFTLPMDESLASCALDLSGRPSLVFKGTFTREKVGELATEMVPHFFQSLSQSLGATIHITVEGVNAHHQVEGVFKAVAKSFRAAIQSTGESSIPSTKGAL